MIPIEFTFTRREPLLREIALKVLLSGNEHVEIDRRFGALLTLADRLLISCIGTTDHGDLPRRLLEAFQSLDGRIPAAGSDILRNCLEGWLKAVLHAANPVRYEASARKSNFNLFQTISDLDLLSKRELELGCEEATKCNDPVRGNILLAKELRNSPAHGAPTIDPFGADLRAGVVSLLAALDRHREAVWARLRGLIVRPLSTESLGLLHRTKSEREHRLRGFVGRRDFLVGLSEVVKAMRRQGGYLVITAPEGFGKSAIAARLTESNNEGLERVGASALQIARDAPWIPGTLLHMGKQSSDPFEFVPALVAQADALLLRPIAPLPAEEAAVTPASATRYDEQGEYGGDVGKRISDPSLLTRLRAKLYEVA